MITNLTEGKIAKQLWLFSLPLLFSALFQQMYNLADSIIAGKFAGENALAAVGVSHPVTMIYMAIAIGCNIGCSVAVSQLFGAGRLTAMKTAVRTSFLSFGTLSLALTGAGFLMCGPILRALNTPENIMGESMVYLNIYIGGLLFLFLYNACNGVFTALGDSRTPLVFLIASSLGNIALDYVFVAVFHWGVAGVAWATFLAQGAASLSALLFLCMRLRRIETDAPPKWFSLPMLRRVSAIALPSVLQQSVVSVGNTLIQGVINVYGSAAVAGCAAAGKINLTVVQCYNAFGSGLSSFAAQNYGAAKIERVRKGFLHGVLMMALLSVPISILLYCGRFQAMALFLNDESQQALETGGRYLQFIMPAHLLLGFKIITDGILRGTGTMKCFVVSTTADLVLRVALVYILVVPFGLNGIFVSWGLGWLLAAVLSGVFYFTGRWLPKKKRGQSFARGSASNQKEA